MDQSFNGPNESDIGENLMASKGRPAGTRKSSSSTKKASTKKKKKIGTAKKQPTAKAA